MSAPLFGLLLAGGRSARMGRDKAAIRYGGRTAIERTMDLLARHVHFCGARARARAAAKSRGARHRESWRGSLRPDRRSASLAAARRSR